MENRLRIRPSVLTWIEVFRKRHSTNFPLAQDAAAPFLITIFDNWWYEDSRTDDSEDFLWMRLQFKVNRLGTRDKWVTFAHEMNCQTPSGLSFVMVSNTWTQLSLKKESSVRRRWSWPLRHAPQPVCVDAELGSLQNVVDEIFTIPNGEEFWEPYVYIIGSWSTNSKHVCALRWHVHSHNDLHRGQPGKSSSCSCRSQVRRLQLKQQNL